MIGSLPLGVAAWVAAAAAGGDRSEPIAAARVFAGVDPRGALAQVEALRGEAAADGDLGNRLAADEVACRVWSDLDTEQALAVSSTGLDAVSDPSGPAREAWLRLRACRAEMWIEVGEVARALDELEQLLSLSSDAHSRGLALVVRGTYRSRAGELELGQVDLLEACDLLREAPAPDRDLCLGHLAGHYRRVGDPREALRLQQQLLDGAHARGATYDESIYAFAAAQSMQELERWAESLDLLRAAAASSEQLGDPLGVSFAEHDTAAGLLRMNRPAEALPHIERSLALLDPGGDPYQTVSATVTLAQVLVGVGRAGEATDALDRVKPAVEARSDRLGLVQWWSTRAQAMRQLGRWREAYDASEAARDLEEQLAHQRLSDQSARMRMQFNRERDAEELDALRRLNAQGQQLRMTQTAALGLLAVVLGGLAVVAGRKIGQARALQRLASTDELTGLPNRRSVGERLTVELRARGPVSALMIDVDHFKRINDVHGHAVGDEVLRQLGRLLGDSVRHADVVGRWGGEEFLALLPGAGPAEAQRIAERMRARVEASPLERPDGALRFTISVGVASGADGELLTRADRALYRAKSDGRNRVVVDG